MSQRKRGPAGPPTPAVLGALLGSRGFGHLWQPTYQARTRCPREASPSAQGWTCSHCGGKGTGPPPATHRERKKQSIWWFKWNDQAGQEHSESTKTSSYEVAQEYQRNRLMDMWGGRLPWEARRDATLGEVLERGITKARTKGRSSVGDMLVSVGRLLGEPRSGRGAMADGKPTPRQKEQWAKIRAVQLGGGSGMVASAVTEDAIDRYVLARRAQGYAPGSINRDLAMLRRAFRVAARTIDAQRRPLVDRVPNIELLPEDNVRQGFPTEAEYQAIRGKLRWCLPNLCDFYRVTGYRNTEPLRLTWAQVDRDAGLIHVDPASTKSRKWRADWPYLKHPVLRAAVEAQWTLKAKVEREQSVIVTHVFFWEDGRPIRDFRSSWDQARRAAGLPHRLVHDFRRMATRDLVRGQPRGGTKTVMRMIGAKTQSIIDRYDINTGEDEAQAVEALAEYHATQAPSPQKVLPFAEAKKG